MKPDNNPLFGHSTLLSKHDSEASGYKNSASGTKMVGIMLDSQNGALCDHNCETDTAWLASEINNKDEFCNTPELECVMIVEDCTAGNGNEISNAVAPCVIASKNKDLFERDIELHSEKNGIGNELKFRESVTPGAIPSREMYMFDTDPYIDKNVLECELPELIVCYKDDTFHLVKDICIDEGVPSKDKVLSERREENGLCTILSSNENKYGGLTGVQDIELLSSSGWRYSSENDSHEVDTHECGTKEEIELLSSSGSESSLDNDSDKVDNSECRTKETQFHSICRLKSPSEHECHEVDTHGSRTKERVETESLTSAENEIAHGMGNVNGSVDLVQSDEAKYNSTDEEVDQQVSREEVLSNRSSTQRSLQSLLDSPNCDTSKVGQLSSQIPFSELPCETLWVISNPEESSKSSPTNNLSYNSKVVSGRATFDFNSLKPAANKREDIPNVISLEAHLKIEDEISDSFSVSTENQHKQGAASFSKAAHPVSGLITYSGAIASSGNVSHRSDSSTTSTRSFAFPVLQNEWNSSPIRMAKADGRDYRRHRGWHGLLCCRF